jgi:WD40 repeat protein
VATLHDGAFGSIGVYDVATGKSLLTVPLEKHDELFYRRSIGISPDGKTIAVGSGRGNSVSKNCLYLWDLGTGKLKQALPHANHVERIAYSPDGKRIASCEVLGREVYIWDSATGKQLAALKHGGAVNDLVFCKGGQIIATASYQRNIMLWDAHSGAKRVDLEWQPGVPKSLAVSADGQTLAWPDSHHWWVRLWKVSDLLAKK